MRLLLSNKLLIFTYCIAIAICFQSCGENKSSVISADKTYFDLSKLIQNDIDHNTANECSEEKTVYIKGTKETKKNDTINWQKELQPLLECDINRTAWKGKFFIDTVASNLTKDTTLQYRALDEKVSVRSLSVVYANSQIKRIIIVKKIESFLFSTVQTIDYIPNMGFVIRGEQKALMMNAFDLNVDVKYLCKN